MVQRVDLGCSSEDLGYFKTASANLIFFYLETFGLETCPENSVLYAYCALDFTLKLSCYFFMAFPFFRCVKALKSNIVFLTAALDNRRKLFLAIGMFAAIKQKFPTKFLAKYGE